MLNCTLAGVGMDRVGIALGSSANGSLVLGNSFSPLQGAPRTTGIALGAATSNAAVHLNDVRAMATGIVCARGSGNSVSNNPGAANC